MIVLAASCTGDIIDPDKLRVNFVGSALERLN